MFWNDYPTISEIKGEEVVLENPGKKEIVETIESLGEDEYLVLHDKILPDNTTPSRFMKKCPELKIRVVDKVAMFHFREELKRFDIERPKRGYKWTNPSNRTSVFVSIPSIIDGARLFAQYQDKISVGGHLRKAWTKVPSRTKDKKYKVSIDPIPDRGGKNWYNFQAECQCGEHFYYKHSSTKYVNPEIYVCPHIVAVYHAAMGQFPKIEDNDPVPPFFPVPSDEMIRFDENLGKTFVKENYRRRINKAERALLECEYQGLRKNGLIFNPVDWTEKLRQ